MAQKQFGFYGSFHGLKLDEGSFTKAFEAAAEKLVRDAAKEWLRAVILEIPKWTGFAQGSVVFAEGRSGTNLARFLRMFGEMNVTQGKTKPKWYYPDFKGKVPKTPMQGGDFGEYNFTSAQHRFRFRYTNNVIHFAIGEFYGLPQGNGPWHSMEAGRVAFDNYIKANIHTLPKLKKFTDPKAKIVHFRE